MDNRMDVIRAFGTKAYLAVADDYDVQRLPEGVNIYRRVRGLEGLNFSPGCLNMGGGNSGFGAFNLAVQKGARRIVLLGYDLHASHEHWHQGYTWGGKVNKDSLYRHWAEQYTYTIGDIQRLKIEVVNACPHSMIECFHKVGLETLPLPPLGLTKF